MELLERGTQVGGEGIIRASINEMDSKEIK